MADDGKLYIIISDKREDGGGIGGNTPAPSSGGTDNSGGKSIQSIITHQFYNFTISQVRKIANYSMTNYGNFTGDYITQRKINEATQTLNILSNIGGAFISGTTMSGGNPVIGAIFAGISALGVGVNAGLSERTQLFNNMKTNYNIDQLRKRAGMNIYLDESRGTEN